MGDGSQQHVSLALFITQNARSSRARRAGLAVREINIDCLSYLGARVTATDLPLQVLSPQSVTAVATDFV